MGRRPGPTVQLPTRPVPYPPYDGTQPCRDIDPEKFFPRTSRDTYYHGIETAEVCGSCPFVEACRDYAVSYDVQGFWAGLSRRDRSKIRAELGIAAIPVGTSDSRMITQLLAELDDGTETSEHVAARVGCSSATVLRRRREMAVA